MGDRRKPALRVQFDGKLRLEFHGAKITSDAGLLAFGELHEALRLMERASTVLADCPLRRCDRRGSFAYGSRDAPSGRRPCP